MPRWYKPGREDLSQTVLPVDLDQTLTDYGKAQELNLRRTRKSDVVGALPRREIELADHALSPMMMEPDEVFEASVLRTFSRLLVWGLGIFFFYSGTLWDKLLRRDSTQRRAKRLLRTIQRIGGTFIKLGQQIAMRVDLMPYEYCAELSKLLDKMPPIPLQDAMAAIQRGTGKKIKEIFARFDPEPIGCASIACVYQAVLLTGEKVAVKVRRPGIGMAFAADLRALSWLIKIVEFLAIIRPGNMRNLASELEDTFMEELDLRLEAYHQEIFRRNCQKKSLTKRFYFSAPRIFFEYTSREVIVQDFVTGIWLGEILAGVEQGNQQALARMRELNIDPRIVARRLIWISMWGNLTNVLFHADPHPANVIVQEDNHIILIDFGACGRVQGDKRNRFLEFMRARQRTDITAMAKAAMALLEPLPRIDLNDFARDLERVYYRASAPILSDKGHWWERTSAMVWLGMLQVSRKYNMPVNADTVKGLRATLLYDTLSVRLDKNIKPRKMMNKYLKDAVDLTGKRTRNQIRKRMRRGWQTSDYARLNEVMTLGRGVFSQVQRFVDNPPFNFAYSIDKPIFAVLTTIRTGGFIGLMMLAGMAVSIGVSAFKGHEISIRGAFSSVLHGRPFLIASGLAVLVGLRRMMFRFGDRDK